MADKTKIAVIGAGISGLSTAYWLDKAGYEVTVFEKSARTGGSIITEKTDGFLIDLGPNSTLETSETLKNLVHDLGLEEQKVYGNEASNNRYVVRGGQLHPIPMLPGKFLKTKLFSAKAKMRLLKEPFIKPTDGTDLSLADFVRYRLGQEFLDYAINPFVAGVYAGDPARLSTAAAFPKLYALEQNYGSFIKGTIKGARERKKRKEVAKDRAKLFSFVNGMQTFTDALAKQLQGKLRLQTEIKSLIKRDSGFLLGLSQGEQSGTLIFDQVVLSVPTYALAGLLENLQPETVPKLKNIYYPPVTVVFMGFKEKDVQRELDGFGFLIPEVENRQILGSIWSSTIFPNRAPEGYVAFTTFVGGARQPQNANLDDENITDLVLRDLDDLVGLSGSPVLVKIKRWKRAIPQYAVGYTKIQHMFNQLEKKMPGLYFAGNFRRGISVGDSVLCARETVDAIVQSKE